MKILLIAPASGRWRKIGRTGLFKGKTFRFSLLSLLSVAAETPKGADIRVVDEQVDFIPYDERFDLVGITCMTALANRAYEIAAQFRERGIPVILGGMHPTFCSEEALQHADAIVAGDAEGVWPTLLEDLKAGRMGGVYRSLPAPSLTGLKRPPRHLLDGKNYGTIQSVQATRGCSNSCDFCSVAAFHCHAQRFRPVEEVRDEVSSLPEKFFIFVDDNLTGDRSYAEELFRSLKPLGKKWIAQSTLSIANDPGFVALAAEAGCIGLFVGLETFSGRNLDAVGKTCHRVGEYRDAIRLLHANGIGVEAGIVFGFDDDTPAVFRHTLDVLDALEIDLIQASVFTPLPGTPRFRAMRDRILDLDWAHYDFHNVVFEPRGMTREELQAGHDWVTRRFYSPRNIFRRLLRHARRPGGLRTLPYHFALNAAYFGRVVRWKIRGHNPETGQSRIPPTRSATEARQPVPLGDANF